MKVRDEGDCFYYRLWRLVERVQRATPLARLHVRDYCVAQSYDRRRVYMDLDPERFPLDRPDPEVCNGWVMTPIWEASPYRCAVLVDAVRLHGECPRGRPPRLCPAMRAAGLADT